MYRVQLSPCKFLQRQLLTWFLSFIPLFILVPSSFPTANSSERGICIERYIKTSSTEGDDVLSDHPTLISSERGICFLRHA